jgi:hypothetical protein
MAKQAGLTASWGFPTNSGLSARSDKSAKKTGGQEQSSLREKRRGSDPKVS